MNTNNDKQKMLADVSTCQLFYLKPLLRFKG